MTNEKHKCKRCGKELPLDWIASFCSEECDRHHQMTSEDDFPYDIIQRQCECKVFPCEHYGKDEEGRIMKFKPKKNDQRRTGSRKTAENNHSQDTKDREVQPNNWKRRSFNPDALRDIAEALETKDEEGVTIRQRFIQMEKNNETIQNSYKDLITNQGIFDTADLEKEILKMNETIKKIGERNWTMDMTILMSMKEERQRLKAEVSKILDDVFPICICPNLDELSKDCKNEWVEDWSSGLNEELKKRLGI